MYECYNRKLLRIDLTARKYAQEEIPPELIENWIGGMGFGIHQLTNEVDPLSDALSSENKLIFSTGPISGTGAPLFAQTCLVTKSPLTGGVTNNYCGGELAAHIKNSGYDFLVFEGKADRLVYVVISDGTVKFVDCPELAGKTVTETEEYIKSKEGKELSTAAIGLAGENLVRFASVISATRVFGRNGAGAVMGSKNLKAFAVGGDCGVRIHNPVAFQETVDEIFGVLQKLNEAPFSLLGSFSQFGTGAGMPMINANYTLATRNHKLCHFEDADKIDGAAYLSLDNVKTRKVACLGCPIHCGQLHYFEGGRFKGMFTRGPEYETMYSLGSNCMNNDPEVLAKAHQLCEDYGMDTLSTGVTVAFGMECAEKGLLNPKDDGVDLKFGNNDSILQAIEHIAKRQGFGDILAEGTKRASDILGADSEQFAMNVKGLEFAAWMPPRLTGIALTFSTSNRGACHKRAPIGDQLTGKIPMDATEGIPLQVKTIQDKVNALFTLVSCRFAEFDLPMEIFVSLLKAASGMEKSVDEFIGIGEKIWNIERLYFLESGGSGKDDKLPERCYETLQIGDGEWTFKKSAFEKMLREYYELRGWNDSGEPTQEKLHDLGIK
ncbi:MAG: aldehyde ferredoxin oxidoreductase family protein [Tepidanaerobacteraceae bacterium]